MSTQRLLMSHIMGAIGSKRDTIGVTEDGCPYIRTATIAEHLLEQGWRPPMREVSTAKELDALPEGTMIVTGPDEDGDWHQFIAQDNARYPRSWVGLHVERFSRNLVRLYDGPYRVVWEPEQ